MDAPRSPTLDRPDAIYPGWWVENGGEGDGYDRDGYDRNGWNPDGVDRAGLSRADHAVGRGDHSARTGAAGIRLCKQLARRIPRSVAAAVMRDAEAMLSDRFPGLSRDPAEAAVIRSGVNAAGDLYVGAYWLTRVDVDEYFVVIVEQGPVNQAGIDPRTTWSATAMWKDSPSEEPGERRLVGLATREELAAGLRGIVESFRPGRKPHAVYIAGAGTAAARFGAMEAAEFGLLQSSGSEPGDIVATVRAEDPDAALAAFSASARRSAGFEAMVRRGMSDAPSGPRP